MSSLDKDFEYVDSLSTQDLELAMCRLNIQVRRGTFKEATYRRLLINKLKAVYSENMIMKRSQARSLTSNRGKKTGSSFSKNLVLLI